MKRFVLLAVASALLAGTAFAAPARAADDCAPRLLVLSAMPVELDPLLARATISDTVSTGGREFYFGSLEGNDVIMALTGIGLNNATATTNLAFKFFGCSIDGVVFSGTSGGQTYIGDVTIPQRWTPDAGAHMYPVDAGMYAVAQDVAPSVKLSSDAPVGDCACAGTDPDQVTFVHMDHAPVILPGGDGASSDPFGGRTLPCFPGGGDVFGCRPCTMHDVSSSDGPRALTGAVPFLDPNFFFGYFQSSPGTPAQYAADDMETGAVAKIAAGHETPFIAFRALSDGKGDPLMLPGFPFQFFIYRQLAADNAAKTALAFLQAWATR